MAMMMMMILLSPSTRSCYVCFLLLTSSTHHHRNMRRSLNPLFQLSYTTPFLHFEARSLISLPNSLGIACFSQTRGALQLLHYPFLCSRIGNGGRFRASRMSSTGSESGSVPSVVARKPSISFCQSCGGTTKHVVPDGEERTRAVCTLCGRIHYENPKMVVGCLVEHNDKVLLCKRKIQPSHGFWTLPAGFMEIGESAVEGATRETLEEACAEVEGLSPFAQIDIPRIGQVYLIFRAKLKKPHFSPGPESLECRLFNLEEIPFDSLAFSSIIVTLRMYVEDMKAGNLKFHYCTISKRSGASMTDPNGFDVDYLLPS